jgi:hypothetical protein
MKTEYGSEDGRTEAFIILIFRIKEMNMGIKSPDVKLESRKQFHQKKCKITV